MTGFLEVLESAQSDTTDVRKAFDGDDGRPVRAAAGKSPQYKMKLAEAAKFIQNIVSGRKPAYLFREVMTTSDFPLLFGDIIDRSVLAAYAEWPSTWEAIAKRSVVNDFRDSKIYPPVWGADGVLAVVGQAAQYPDAQLYEQTPITWHVTKYGRQVPFSWESIVNDDLDQLKDVPLRLGRAARRTENSLVTALYVGTTGPLAAMYTVAAKNIINTTNGALVTNPPLSIAGLQDAYTVLNSMLDESGAPILREAVTLVVPPALEVTARNILNATQIWATAQRAGGSPETGNAGGFQELNIQNWMRNKLTLIVDPYIPAVATTNGNTSWFLFANPNTSREAIRIGFLRGHETPEIWMKSPNAVRVGGGTVNPMDGDFDTDAVTYRVRHVVGTTMIDGKATVASNGTGS